METRGKILDSLLPVLAKTEYVSIDEERIKAVAKEFTTIEVPLWDNNFQLLGTPEETAYYYFFLDSINFCFWAPKGVNRWEYEVEGKWISGYYAYSRAIKDAFLRDKRFFDANYLSSISEINFRNIFAAGKNELLLMPERHAIIRENFSILKEQFNGSVLHLLEEARGDADMLVDLLLKHFSSFRDTIDWHGSTLYFLKRAQIFPSDLSFSGIDSLKLSHLDHLAAFADYKLPQVLESLGILKYSDELNADIQNETIIPAGSQKEIELRTSTIVAIDRIREVLVRLGRNIATNELDWILWVKAKQTKFKKPHHKTLTTFY